MAAAGQVETGRVLPLPVWNAICLRFTWFWGSVQSLDPRSSAFNLNTVL
jgi:hypothetical protein